MKHSFHDILTMFKAHLGHSEQHALQTVYDAGHANGVEEVKTKLLEGDNDLHRELNDRFQAAHPFTPMSADEAAVNAQASRKESGAQGLTEGTKTDDNQKAQDPGAPQAPQPGQASTDPQAPAADPPTAASGA